jgi:hypothetical protein
MTSMPSWGRGRGLVAEFVIVTPLLRRSARRGPRRVLRHTVCEPRRTSMPSRDDRCHALDTGDPA